MTAQWIAVAIIVPLSALYAIWQLIGSAARRRVVAWLARGPWPAALRSRLARAHAAAPACGCDGCPAADLERSARSIVRVHRRVR